MSSPSVPAAEASVGDLRQVFRALPQPVAVITGLGPAGQPVGMTVSSLTPVSLAPPLLLFCPAVTSQAWVAARDQGTFAVNILSHQHGDLAARFAGRGERFAGVRTESTAGGTPVLADALSVVVCDVWHEHPAGDHLVVVGRIREIHRQGDGIALDTVSMRASNAPTRRPPSAPWSGSLDARARLQAVLGDRRAPIRTGPQTGRRQAASGCSTGRPCETDAETSCPPT